MELHGILKQCNNLSQICAPQSDRTGAALYGLPLVFYVRNVLHHFLSKCAAIQNTHCICPAKSAAIQGLQCDHQSAVHTFF